MGNGTMGGYGMNSARLHTKGFTLITSLLLLLLSGMAIGLLMMVNSENRVGGSDMQNDVAYHAAEGGIEKMASDLAGVLQNAQATTASEICGVGGPAFGGSAANEPALPGVTWTEYQVTPGALGSNCPNSIPKPSTGSDWNQISTGPNAGLWAQVIPISMQATAAMPGGQEVSMMRSAQIALIPVFQFGVFCEGDCDFFSTPTLDFNGRVHANGNLYLGVGGGNTLTFHHKLEAYGNVVEDYLTNGVTVSDGNDTGDVYIPTNDPGCLAPVAPKTAANYPPTGLSSCVLKDTNGGSTYGDGSVTGKGSGLAQSGSSYNTSIWNTFSGTTTNHEIVNGNYYVNGATTPPGTGARKLSMPFVSGTNFSYELIRRPPAGEDPTTALSSSREYNMAQIHVLLTDDPAELPGGASDKNNVRLANVTQTTGNTTVTPWGVTIPQANYNTALFGTSAGNTYNLYFASASNAVPIPSTCSTASGSPPTPACTPDWPYAPGTFAAWSATQGLQPAGAPSLWSYGTPTISICPPASPAPAPASVPAGCPTAGSVLYPYYALPIPDTPVVGSALTNYPQQASSNAWSLIDGYLRVEYKDSSGNWHPVTNEWLQLGFARGVTPPTQSEAGTPAAGTPTPIPNPINPHAILLLQEPADRSIVGSATLAAEPTAVSGVWAVSKATAPTCSTHTGSGSSAVCTAWTAGSPAVPTLAADSGVSGGQWVFGVTPTAPSVTTPQSLTQFNWYPINFYDAREGEARDVDQGNNSCTTNGVMNAVEIDVGNLQQWLQGNIGTTGANKVDYATQNGYVLYFSDRRGMLLNPNLTSSHPANTKSGDSGLEDVVNSSSQVGTPSGTLEPTFWGSSYSPAGTLLSPEDVNENGVLDNWGTADLGLGFWNSATVNLNAKIVAATPNNPYSPRITSCSTTGRKNWVSGARHVLKLVDGSLGNLPITPVGTQETIGGTTKTYYGGFTVASENPVYIQGDYNSVTNPTLDTFFSNQQNTAPAKDETGYVPAAVIADAVTLLSNNWDDRVSMLGIPTQTDITYTVANTGPHAGNREASTTSYRVAVAGGKNLPFPFPSWANTNPDYSFGTDGGTGNFLRFLEDWLTPPGGQQTLNYGGSLVSLYYSTYGTGIFKCCEYSVYAPPNRNYVFDVDFTLQGGVGLPPGTPLFRDVETLGYRQMFTTRDSSSNQ